MQRRVVLFFLLLIFASMFAGAEETENENQEELLVEGHFQVNSVFMTSQFPIFGDGGLSNIRFDAAGIGVKGSLGDRVRGVIDITVLFPYIYEEQEFPALKHTSRSLEKKPFFLDAVVGLGYFFRVPPLFFLISGGFHVGFLFEDGLKNNLSSFGTALDVQSYMKLGKVFSLQLGVRVNLDFGGTQNFSGDSNSLAGSHVGFSFYTGLGLNI